MAGKFPGFNGDDFRTGIRLAYNMGLPPEIDDVTEAQLRFHFATQLVYTGPTDGEGVPFDPNTTVTRVTPTPVIVPCGIEYVNAPDEDTPFGSVLPTKVRVSLLDDDYVQVKDATFVVLGGEKYVYHHTEAPSGLFDVGIYVIVYVAENDL